MKTKLLLSILICAFTTQNSVIAQTGPGGIGNSTTNRVWLDASTLSLPNGATVSGWSDISGNGWVANTTSSFTRPVFRTSQLNGFPSVDFDGSNDFLKINSVSGLNGQPISWFIVGNFNTTARSQAMLHFFHTGSSTNKNLRFTLCYNNGSIARITSTNLNTAGGGIPATHSFNTSTQVFSTIISASDIQAFSNGSLTGSNSGTFYSPVNNNSLVTLGRRASSGDYYMDGNVAEMVIFNYELNTPERTIVENYLGSKYALGLGNDKYALEGSGHYFNVTGIGMEGGNSVTDNEGGSGVQINTASALDDGDYLLWGHDNAALTQNITDLPAEMLTANGARLEKTWRIDETGDVGTYNLHIDMTGITLGLDPNKYVLMIDDDGDFTNGGTTIDSINFSYDIINEIATWTGIDIPDGSYFTIGYFPRTIISITSGDWSNPNTWNCTCVPNFGNNAIISDGDVVTVDVNSTINALTISATGTLDFSGGSQLSIGNNLTGNGTLDGTDGILSFDGNLSQLINAASAIFETATFNNASGVAVNSGSINVTGSMTVTAGNLDLGNNYVTLNSDATSTARIGQSNGTFSGTMIVERYIDTQFDGWGNISSPVSNATFTQWSDDMVMEFGPYVPFISEPSVYGYNESVWDYFAIETATTSIDVAEGYEAYLQTDTDEGSPFAATVVDIIGTPNRGTLGYAVTADNDGWNLVGNPYASYIDWTNFSSNCGVSLGANFLYYDESIDDYSSGGAGDELAQSQGFWIEALAAGTVNFRETNKTTSTNSSYRSYKEVLFGLRVSSRMMEQKPHTYFRLNDDGDVSYVDGKDQKFLKLPNPISPLFYTYSSDEKRLRINDLKSEKEMLIPVYFIARKDGEYQIDMVNSDIIGLQGYSTIYLEDKKTGVFHNMNAGAYEFEGSTSDANNRFVLHFEKNEEMGQSLTVTSFQPSDEIMTVEYEGAKEGAEIRLFNSLGQEIGISSVLVGGKGNITINTSSLPAGIFYIRVISGEEMVSKPFYKN